MLRIDHLKTDTFSASDIVIVPGTCLAVTGPSGSGKSRFLRAVVDLDPNEGTIWLDGTERDRMPAPHWRTKIAYIPAESAWWSAKVGDHFPATAGNIDFAALDLPADCLSWPVSRLSTGERQRLALARALAHDPPVILLDEPTSSLDEATTGRLEAYLASLKAAGKTLILVSHDPRQVDALADQVIRFEAGKIVNRNTP